ncbi:hypothetical protein PanWU01x14_193170 [Parasponia andersonii]|uniref:Uncharacterized protein n=1 Tax=Parasponia andersonii TaxID=3476 RepID=A0A2P5C0Z3_PARAD|nr:hypothetical protein PanWU01x14_193170 [Parasponia andersonii]
MVENIDFSAVSSFSLMRLLHVSGSSRRGDGHWYCFVGHLKESRPKIMAWVDTGWRFWALNNERFGLRQGLVKGLAIRSNGIVFAIWAFLSYYSIRLVMYDGTILVMYDGVKGGTLYAMGSSIIFGGR